MLFRGKVIFLGLFIFASISFAEDDPCQNLLSLINRPTFSDSVCVVKWGRELVESGYLEGESYPNPGHISNFPQTVFRVGLPKSNELEFIFPSYSKYTNGEDKIDGISATGLALKHQFTSQGPWIYATEAIVVTQSGSKQFGSAGSGIIINGLATRSITSSISFSIMLGISSQTTQANAGGQRYNSFNPDFVIAWQPQDFLQFYVEIYGQTKTYPNEGSGWNSDAGIQYLLNQDIEVDLVYSTRLSGALGGFSHYVGFGGGLRF